MDEKHTEEKICWSSFKGGQSLCIFANDIAGNFSFRINSFFDDNRCYHNVLHQTANDTIGIVIYAVYTHCISSKYNLVSAMTCSAVANYKSPVKLNMQAV